MTDRALPNLPSRDLDATMRAAFLIDIDATQLTLIEDAGQEEAG